MKSARGSFFLRSSLGVLGSSCRPRLSVESLVSIFSFSRLSAVAFPSFPVGFPVSVRFFAAASFQSLRFPFSFALSPSYVCGVLLAGGAVVVSSGYVLHVCAVKAHAGWTLLAFRQLSVAEEEALVQSVLAADRAR